MGLRIATNVQALAAQRFLAINKEAQNKSLERLSSGSRINRSGDDAAGLAISEQLRANVRSMKQAIRNANDGISLVQVAEGGMNEVGNILVRLRELSIQAASDTIGDKERTFLDKEVQQLKDEVQRIAQVTEFNGRKLINGSGDALEIQIGLKNDPFQDRLIFDPAIQNTTAEALGIAEMNTLTKNAAQKNLEIVDTAIHMLNKNRSNLGALQNRLSSTVQNMMIYQENLETANSRIRDTDLAGETSELMKQNILTQSTISVLVQANQNAQAALALLNG